MIMMILIDNDNGNDDNDWRKKLQLKSLLRPRLPQVVIMIMMILTIMIIMMMMKITVGQSDGWKPCLCSGCGI